MLSLAEAEEGRQSGDGASSLVTCPLTASEASPAAQELYLRHLRKAVRDRSGRQQP